MLLLREKGHGMLNMMIVSRRKRVKTQQIGVFKRGYPDFQKSKPGYLLSNREG